MVKLNYVNATWEEEYLEIEWSSLSPEYFFNCYSDHSWCLAYFLVSCLQKKIQIDADTRLASCIGNRYNRYAMKYFNVKLGIMWNLARPIIFRSVINICIDGVYDQEKAAEER